MDERVWDLAVVGGGAAGLVTGITAASCGDRVIILEKGPALGRKISASGNGRCNIMNKSGLKYYGESAFAEKVFQHCSQERLIRFWNSIGLMLCEDQDGRLYPFTYHSGTVMDTLKTALQKFQVKTLLQSCVTGCTFSDPFFTVSTEKESHSARRLLIATGGAAQPRLGGNPDGYRMLQNFGHSMVPVFPALCPVVTDAKSISGLSGTRVRCSVQLIDQKREVVRRERGEVLFTDTGISGICAMQMARFIQKDDYDIELDFLDRLDRGQEELTELLKERKKIFHEMSAVSLLYGMLVPKLAFAVMKQAGIEVGRKTAGSLSDQEIQNVAEKLRHYTLHVQHAKGLDDAQVTAGGIMCEEFSDINMESKVVPGLYAAGEVLNVDGDCGGYNLMFACASGLLAGMNGRKGTDL